MDKYIREAIHCLILTVVLIVGMSVSSLGAVAEVANSNPVASHSQQEIKSYYMEHTFDLEREDVWEVAPDAGAGIEGVLSEESQKNMLNALNFARYVAGLDEVSLAKDYTKKAQAGAELLSAAGTLSHYPARPDNMSAAFYYQAIQGLKRSNIAAGYKVGADAVMSGWMKDGNASKMTKLGNRRWILDPDMKYTGFGRAKGYTLMYSFDGYNQNQSYDADYIAWPAVNMPSKYFSGKWSIQLNPAKYGDSEDITVEVKDMNGENVTILDKSEKKKLQYDYQSEGSYGRSNAIIFDPSVSTEAGNSYQVSVRGLKDPSGKAAEDLVYEVHFFDIDQTQVAENKQESPKSQSKKETAAVMKKDETVGKDSDAQDERVTDEGRWEQVDGKWRFISSTGEVLRNKWARLYNPYALQKKDKYGWYRFDQYGDMMVGWYKDTDGTWYYLNKNTDGTLGSMATGWHKEANGNLYYFNSTNEMILGSMATGWQWIEDNGVKKCYYFYPKSDGFQGFLMKSTQANSCTVNENGEWTVDGVVQTM